MQRLQQAAQAAQAAEVSRTAEKAAAVQAAAMQQVNYAKEKEEFERTLAARDKQVAALSKMLCSVEARSSSAVAEAEDEE
eukprot:4667631-Prymnesium_polylepis.1